MLATNLTIRYSKRYFVVLCISLIVWGLLQGPLRSKVYEIPPKTQSEVGQDNNWVVGGVTCCHILDNLLKKEKHLFLMHLFLFFGGL